MLRLHDRSAEIRTDLGHGVTLIHRRVGSGAIAIARAMASAIDAGEVSAEASGARRLAFARCVARHVALRWEGVEDEAGQKAEMTPDGLDALLDLYPVLEAFEVSVIGPALVLDAEKNASSPSPDGTSERARSTARSARSGARNARHG